MNNKSPSKAVTRLAHLAVVTSALAALVACGGGGDAATESKLSARLQAIDTSACVDGVAGATSTGGVLPTYCPTFESSNPPLSCAQLFPGSKELLVFMGAVPYTVYEGTQTNGVNIPSWLSVTLNGSSPYMLEWAATDTATIDYQVVGVAIKNASQTHIYDYTGGSASGDQQLDPPEPTAPLLWYNVCYVEKPVVTGPAQWCSPGYWKNHTEAWVATGIAPTTPYALSSLTVKTTGKDCASASATPSLYQVVSMPQCYGGEAANLVGDLLSSAHPDVNYQGERVENCPLN